MTVLDDQNNPNNEALSAIAVAQLQKSAGWAMFLGVVSALILFGGGIGLIIVGSAFARAYQSLGYYESMGAGNYYKGEAIITGSLCLVLVIGIIVGTVIMSALFKYANAINQFASTKSAVDLETAFASQNQALRFLSYLFMVGIVYAFLMAIILSALGV